MCSTPTLFNAGTPRPQLSSCFLTTVSDDLDGMRKIPDNVPSREAMEPHLQKPLTSVPDPFGEYPSFGDHNNAMLRRFPNTLGFAVDDAHIRPDEPAWNGGWIVVNAPELTPSAIITAIRAGNFYSSRGPDFRGIGLDGRVVHVKVSPVSVVRLIGPAYWSRRVCAGEGQVLTEVQMEIPDEWPYALIEIEDGAGRRAWTNTLFCSEGGHD